METVLSDPWNEHWGRCLIVATVAILCGAILGCERELHRHRAGLRTITLICLGSAVFVLAGRLLAIQQGDWPDWIQMDPGRIASYVVAGVGFLGAGPIIHRDAGPNGLTTAATIWMAAAIGMLAGMEMLLSAGVVTALSLAVLRGLALVSSWLGGGHHCYELLLNLPPDTLTLARLEHVLQSSGIVKQVVRRWREDGGIEVAIVYCSTPADAADLLGLISSIATVCGAALPAARPSE